ncbi:hypothetical protein [Naasia lichenicola]|uniref:Uncharacterized protein n=1 Tax=Naasia lichenicola TaxID=2565933 RepID=A0A4S4FJF0_9MICO|nr:hypothetical protein [Naasia lichenicola]THG29982.1 hypothetical protein E6C64_15170 [Naasia lichenicola]
MFPLFLDAAWKVLLAAVVLGAGLPALFAVGVRSFALAGAGSGPLTDDDGRAIAVSAPTSGGSTGLRILGVVCVVLVLAAVAVGLTVIIAGGFGKAVSFENVFPMIVDK